MQREFFTNLLQKGLSMGTSFKYVVFTHHRKKDGTIPVCIRMTHNGKSKYETTSLVVTKEQVTRKMDRITDQTILDSINRKLSEYRQAVAAIDGAEYYTADELWDAVRETMRGNRHNFHLDLFDFAEGQMQRMEPKTAEGYKTALNALKRFVKCDRLDINRIDYPFLLDFRDFLATEPPVPNGKGKHQAKTKGSRAVSYYLSCLRSLHNMARAIYNDDADGTLNIPRQPFKKGLIPAQPSTKHRTLTVAQMKALAAVELPQGSQAALARDVFMLSFAMIGENTIDLYHATTDEVKNGIQTYNRRKTDSVRPDNALMKVRIEPEAEAIINQYGATDGHHLLNFHARYSDHRNFNNMVNKGLKKVAEAVNEAADKAERLPEDLNFYYARHTWSTLAMNICGYDFDTVHQALNHARRGADRVTGIYIERDFTKAWEANRKVLDLMK